MRTLVCLLALWMAPTAAFADSWGPFQDSREVSPTGKTYVIIRQFQRGVTFELCRRRAGAPAMKPALAADRFGIEEGEGGPIDRDPLDRLLARGEIDHLPLDVRVLDEPASFLLLDRYAGVGYGTTISYVGSSGKVVFQRRLKDLFDAAIRASFSHSVSSIWWNQGWLVDESAGRLLVAAGGDRLRAVALADGKVTTPASSILLGHLRTGSTTERALAWELAGRLKPAGLEKRALAVALDATQPTPIRLRAAVASKQARLDPAIQSLFLQSIEGGNPGAVRGYAATHLADVMGVDAIPVLRRLLRGPADNDVWSSSKEALRSLGQAAVPALLEMLLDVEQSSDYRGAAAHVLGHIGVPSSVGALLEATAHAPEYVANAAVNAAIAIDPPDLGKRLAAILTSGSTQDGRIAMYFEEHPAAYVRAPLQKALTRAKEGSFDRKFILDALKALDKLK